MKSPLSPLELEAMQVIWSRGASTAEEVRQSLEPSHRLKESTVRTLLRRMEKKGFVRHKVRGRTYIYEEALPPERAAVRAVRNIVDRFCEGSVEALLVGMVKDEVIDPEELRELAESLSQSEEEK